MTAHIEQHLERVIAAAADGNPQLCIVLESISKPAMWMQIAWDMLNASYPFADEPRAKLQALGIDEYPYLEVTSWEPHKYATLAHGADPVPAIAAFVVAYFEKMLGVSAAPDALRIEEQQL